MAAALERQFTALRPGDHLCLIYDSPATPWAALVPFVNDGLARGERVVYLADERTRDEAADALTDAGITVAREQARGALVLLTKGETPFAGQPFDPQEAIAFVRHAEEQALAAGCSGLRVIFAMTWALAAEPPCPRLIEYEALLNRSLADSRTIGLCLYDRSRFGADILHDVLRTHPLVVLGDQVCTNIYYEPPEFVLGSAGPGDPKACARRVDWMIAQLQKTRQAEQEREQLVEQLRMERTRLEAVLNQMPGGVLIAEAPSGKIVLANDQLGRIADNPVHRQHSLEEYSDWQAFHADGRPYQVAEWPLVRSMLHGEVVAEEEMAFMRRGGGRGVLSASSAPIRNAAGEVTAVVVTTHDITARKQAEDALRASEQRHRLLFERNLAGVYRSTVSGRLLDCNDSFAHILGYASRVDVLRQEAADFYFDPTDRAAFLTALQQGGTLSNYEAVMRRPDGGRVWVLENTNLLTGADGSPFIEGTLVDITSRKSAEEAAYLSAARYRSLIENLAQGISLKDTALRYVVANKPFCDALGCSESAIIGKTDFDFYAAPVAEKYHAEDMRVFHDGQRVETEQQDEVQGKPRVLRVVKTPVQNDRGQTVGVLGIYWDVTEQQALEAQLRQAQKMEAVGLLAGGVAHDFNNLLAVILGNIALSLGSMPEDHPNRELLSAAERAGVQAAELTNHLLGFARQTILRPVPCHLELCMEETVRLLRRTIDPRITLDVRPAADLWMVEADPTQMNQVLMNLCLNARDAIPQDGRIIQEADNVVIDGEFARQHVEARPGEFVRLRISDTGHGIPPEIRARIFEPFFTTKAAGKGTGLGLAMVFGIVKQHQGWIDCYSEVGQGTRFDIYLPRHGPWQPHPAAAPELPSLEARGGTETILLADDEPMIRALGRTILERYGYDVLLAEDGWEAVQIYREQRQRIDLVILDLTMPRLSGHDAMQQLLQIDPQVRVLFASGYSAAHVTREHQDRILGFLSKPYRPEQLARTVREALDRATALS